MSCFGLCGNDKKQPNISPDHDLPKPSPPRSPPPDVVIIDFGTCNVRAGFAGDEEPLITIPTVVGTSVRGNATQKVFGSAAITKPNEYKLSYPVEKGLIKSFHDAEDILEFVFEHHLQIKPNMHQLLLTEPLNNPTLNKEKTAEMIIEKFQFNSFLLMPSTIMGLFGCASTTGIVVESGGGQTHIVAVKDGEFIRQSYRHIPIGGKDLTNYLKQTKLAGYLKGKPNEHEIVEKIKCKGCFVTIDYDEATRYMEENPEVHRTVELEDLTFNLRHTSFQLPELLFRPELVGIKTGGIPKNIVSCVEACDPDLHGELYSNIFLCGGNTMFESIEERLLNEVEKFIGPDFDICIINPPSPPPREDLVFLGTSLVGVCPRLKDNLITRQEYLEFGPQIVNWKCI